MRCTYRSRYRSAAHFIALLLSHRVLLSRETVHSVSLRHQDQRKRLLRLSSVFPHAHLPAARASPRADATVRILLSVLVWLLWFGCILYVLFSALEDFLLVGTSTSAAWPYAAIQNLVSQHVTVGDNLARTAG